MGDTDAKEQTDGSNMMFAIRRIKRPLGMSDEDFQAMQDAAAANFKRGMGYRVPPDWQPPSRSETSPQQTPTAPVASPAPQTPQSTQTPAQQQAQAASPTEPAPPAHSTESPQPQQETPTEAVTPAPSATEPSHAGRARWFAAPAIGRPRQVLLLIYAATIAISVVVPPWTGRRAVIQFNYRHEVIGYSTPRPTEHVGYRLIWSPPSPRPERDKTFFLLGARINIALLTIEIVSVSIIASVLFVLLPGRPRSQMRPARAQGPPPSRLAFLCLLLGILGAVSWAFVLVSLIVNSPIGILAFVLSQVFGAPAFLIGRRLKIKLRHSQLPRAERMVRWGWALGFASWLLFIITNAIGMAIGIILAVAQ